MGTSFNVFKVLIFFKSISELAILFASNSKEDASDKTSKISILLLVSITQVIVGSSVATMYRYFYKNKSVASTKNGSI